LVLAPPQNSANVAVAVLRGRVMPFIASKLGAEQAKTRAAASFWGWHDFC
jgi:hypothetical protein